MKTMTEPDGRTQFQNFKELAQKLVAVPKKELDEKQAEYEREKKRAKQKKAKREPIR